MGNRPLGHMGGLVTITPLRFMEYVLVSCLLPRSASSSRNFRINFGSIRFTIRFLNKQGLAEVTKTSPRKRSLDLTKYNSYELKATNVHSEQ